MNKIPDVTAVNKLSVGARKVIDAIQSVFSSPLTAQGTGPSGRLAGFPFSGQRPAGFSVAPGPSRRYNRCRSESVSMA
jgi:hypothetical protein